MLSTLSRFLTYLLAALYAVLGALLFFMPEQLAPVFAWKVTPFMTMTIGGWCLGNAWLAFFAARRWKWEKVFTSLLYLWLFGVGELLVLFFFRDKLVLKHPVAWLYLVTLLTNAGAAYVGAVEVARHRPRLRPAPADRQWGWVSGNDPALAWTVAKRTVLDTACPGFVKTP